MSATGEGGLPPGSAVRGASSAWVLLSVLAEESLVVDLRYGINPHQAARIVNDPATAPLRVVSGEPSYINLLDALNAWQLVYEAATATGRVVAASFKHVSPAGAATAGAVDAVASEIWGVDGTVGAATSAYVRARDADPKSSFGDMIAVSHPVDRELADLLSRVISDGVIAPGFEPGTTATLAGKRAGAFLVFEADQDFQPPQWERRDYHGLVLEQRRDSAAITSKLLGGAGLTAPESRDALLGLVTARRAQSNSVVLVKDGMMIGVGAGQQNRVDCVRLAAAKARTWWLRRHPQLRALSGPAGMRRQERLNWQIRMADGDMTRTQRAEFAALFPGVDPDLGEQDRSDWIDQLDHVTLVSDGFLPFRDNIDHAAGVGVRHVVEPGGPSDPRTSRPLAWNKGSISPGPDSDCSTTDARWRDALKIVTVGRYLSVRNNNATSRAATAARAE